MSEEPEIKIAKTKAYRLALFETHLHKVIEDINYILTLHDYPEGNWGEALIDLRSRCRILSGKWDDILKVTI